MEGLNKENLRSSCAQMRSVRGHDTLSLSSNTLFEPTSRSLRAQTPLNVVSALEALITCSHRAQMGKTVLLAQNERICRTFVIFLRYT